jgi:hypothetical protein
LLSPPSLRLGSQRCADCQDSHAFSICPWGERRTVGQCVLAPQPTSSVFQISEMLRFKLSWESTQGSGGISTWLSMLPAVVFVYVVTISIGLCLRWRGRGLAGFEHTLRGRWYDETLEGGLADFVRDLGAAIHD